MNTRNDSTIRQYRPNLGQLIKMSEFSDYSSRGLSVWEYLRVIGVDADTVTAKPAPSPQDPSQNLPAVTIPLHAVQAPLGWEARYTMYVKPGDVDKVLGWFARGIVRRISHDIGAGRSDTWQPADNANSPHWAYPEVCDVIAPGDCKRLLRVVKVEREEIGSFGPAATCTCCKGTGIDTVARLVQVWTVSEAEAKTQFEANGAHYLKTREYDAARGTFKCFCGTYMRDLGRTKRAKVIAQMKSEGWEVEYVRAGEHSYWERTRETVVSDWEGV